MKSHQTNSDAVAFEAKRKGLNGKKSVLAALLLAAVCAHAAADDIKIRQQQMKDWRALNKQMGALLNQGESAFAAAEFAVLAEKLAQTANAPWQHFPAGSNGRGSDAAEEVWTKPQAFQASVQQFNEAAAALNRAAQSRNYAAVKTAFGQVGQSCKSCHRDFKD